MKKNINSLLVVAAAAIALVACSKEEQQVRNESGVVTFHALSPATKTTFGTLNGNKYPTIWTANDANIKIAQNFSNGVNAAVTKVSDTEATFSAEIEDDKSGSYTFYAVTPASAVVSGVNKSNFSWNLEIPTEQTSSASGPDERAMLMAATSSTTTVFPSEVNLAFKHLTAYGKMSILNLGLAAGDAVSSVLITASNNLAYRYYYYVGGAKKGQFEENASRNAITIHTSSASDIWFACAPLAEGTELTIAVTTTNSKVYTKENIAIPAALAAGHVAVFNVDFAGITPPEDKVYNLVTSYDELTAGSKVIIAAVGDVAYAAGIGTTSSDYISAVSQSKSADNSKIVNPAATVDVFTISAGADENTIALEGTNGFLYAKSSSSNYMGIQTTNNVNGYWTPEITDVETGSMSLVATGSSNRNIMRYNNDRFSCYAPTSAVTALQALYKLEGSGSGPSLITTYTVSYDGNGATGGSVPESVVTTGTFTVAAAGDLKKTGYSFNGWNTAADGSGTAYAAGASATATSDVTLYAQWKAAGGGGGGDIATATFNGKDGTYTEGWTTTGTGKTRTDCIIIGSGENITSPSFDFSNYSSVTISIKARRFGNLTGSKATIDASIGGVSVGTTDATSTNATSSLADIKFTPTSSMTNATLVFTCTNATSAGSTHGAGINTITITGILKN